MCIMISNNWSIFLLHDQGLFRITYKDYKISGKYIILFSSDFTAKLKNIYE